VSSPTSQPTLLQRRHEILSRAERQRAAIRLAWLRFEGRVGERRGTGSADHRLDTTHRQMCPDRRRGANDLAGNCGVPRTQV
jgi:hypothetical protein